MVTDLADAGNNQIKYDSDPHRRWRPGAQQKLTHVFTIPSGGDTNVYLCDCTIQAASYAMCGENCNCTDDVDSFTNTEEFTNGNASFPSGHSAKAYLAFLCCVEVDGNFGDKSRILDYCENRTVVRAHWITDVTAGRLGASMQIGYLNGFEEYHKLIRNM
jgi:membrane-associated phospholipid phosphatase